MSSDSDLTSWIQREYQICGINTKGEFVGKDRFKKLLISRYQTSRREKCPSLKIRQLVNSGVYVEKQKSSQKSGKLLTTPPLKEKKTSTQKSQDPLPTPPLKEKQTSTQKSQDPLPTPPWKEKETSTQKSQDPLPTPPLKEKQNSTQKSQDPLPTPPLKEKQKFTQKSQDPLPSSPPKAPNGEPSNTDRNNLVWDGDLSLKWQEVGKLDELDTTVPALGKNTANLASLNPRLRELKEFAEKPQGNLEREIQQEESRSLPTLDDQFFLLQSNNQHDQNGQVTCYDCIKDAPIFSADVLTAYEPKVLPQHGLLGTTSFAGQTRSCSTSRKDSRLFHNTNIPFSIFICGLQGSGKSHTLSCLLENYLIQSPVLGILHKGLSALVFHFGQFTSPSSFRPCEAAFLAYPNREFPNHPSVTSVNVYVAPSNYHNLKASYGHIPGVHVQPFKLRPSDLNVGSMLSLMLVDQSASTPLYIGQVTKILRAMASTSSAGFNYIEFKRRLEASKLSRAQQVPLQQRLELLESFIVADDSIPASNFKDGGLTIIDLSCPFVDANMACVLFNIGVGLYLESGLAIGKVIAVDEAHKYMADTPASKALTESLLSVIRQQRHFGVRVIISTQEPTISPRLMELCSMTVVHRFTSPEWFTVLRRHISMDDEKNDSKELFRRILNLRVGEALLFAPSALLEPADGATLATLGSDLLQVQVRRRLTWDGGKSIVCV